MVKLYYLPYNICTADFFIRFHDFQSAAYVENAENARKRKEAHA